MKWLIELFKALFGSKTMGDTVPPAKPLPEIPTKEDVDNFPNGNQTVRNINHAGLELIKHFEGLYLKPYIDPVGIPTIGIGSIAYENRQKVKMSDPAITEKRALELLDFELNEKELIVDKFLKSKSISFNDNQFSAVVSICYNCGVGILTQPARSFHKSIISGDADRIKSAFRAYNKGTKKVLGIPRKVELPGLTRRREAEVKLFFS